MAFLELPHWLMIGGAVLVIAGLIGHGLSRNKNLESDRVLLPVDTSEERNARAEGPPRSTIDPRRD